jgi:hypothetical protein
MVNTATSFLGSKNVLNDKEGTKNSGKAKDFGNNCGCLDLPRNNRGCLGQLLAKGRRKVTHLLSNVMQ